MADYMLNEEYRVVKGREDDAKHHGNEVKTRRHPGAVITQKMHINKKDVDENKVKEDVHNATIVLRGDWPPDPLPFEPDFDVVRRLFNITNAGMYLILYHSCSI